MKFFILASSALFALAAAECSTPNNTDTKLNWWPCSSGPIQFYDVKTYDSNGKDQYPVHLGQPLLVRADINNPTNTYSAPNLRNTLKLWSYGGWAGCTWSSVPTLGLLSNLDACANGVACPVKPGRQILDIIIDFSQFESIIKLLKDNAPYQIEMSLSDNVSGDNSCIRAQAWARIP